MARLILMFAAGFLVALLGVTFFQNNGSRLPSGALVAFPDDCLEDWQ